MPSAFGYNRLNSIFSNGAGSGNVNALGDFRIPSDLQQDPITEYATRVLPLIHGEQNRQLGINQRLSYLAREQAKQDAAEAANHPNVVTPQAIPPLAQAQLALKKEDLEDKNSRAAASLGVKEDLASSSNTTRQSLATAGNAIKNRALDIRQNSSNTEDKIRQQRADIYAYKAKHPDIQFLPTKGGPLHYYDPATREVVDTGIDSGTLTQEDAIRLGIEGRLDEIGAQGENTRALATMRGDSNVQAIQERGNQTRLTNAARPVTTRPQSESDKKVGYYNKAMQLANSGYGKYILPGQSPNTFVVDPTTPGDLYHQINEQIYGNPAAKDISLPTDDKTFKPGTASFAPGTNSGEDQKKSSGNPDGKLDPIGILKKDKKNQDTTDDTSDDSSTSDSPGGDE